jgi:protocatechuate 3,4-dioxygenase beta subunit
VSKRALVELYTAYKEDKPAREKWNKVNHQDFDKQTKDPQSLFDFSWADKPFTRPAVCITTPENIYGPFWHEGQLERRDIRSGQEGVYLRLAMQVIDIATCTPLQDARVDVWQANALGSYSETNTSWLRGWQLSSNWGTVDFDTIFPGNYGGRNVHTHVAVRAPGDKRIVHSGQLFFDEYPREWISVRSLRPLSIPD